MFFVLRTYDVSGDDLGRFPVQERPIGKPIKVQADSLVDAQDFVLRHMVGRNSYLAPTGEVVEPGNRSGIYWDELQYKLTPA